MMFRMRSCVSGEAAIRSSVCPSGRAIRAGKLNNSKRSVWRVSKIQRYVRFGVCSQDSSAASSPSIGVRWTLLFVLTKAAAFHFPASGVPHRCVALFLLGRLTLKGAKPPAFHGVPVTLGDHSKKRRLELRLLQREVGERIGVSPFVPARIRCAPAPATRRGRGPGYSAIWSAAWVTKPVRRSRIDSAALSSSSSMSSMKPRTSVVICPSRAFLLWKWLKNVAGTMSAASAISLTMVRSKPWARKRSTAASQLRSRRSHGLTSDRPSVIHLSEIKQDFFDSFNKIGLSSNTDFISKTGVIYKS